MKGSTEACSNAEVEIMKKLREAYENDVVAVNVSSQPSRLGCPCFRAAAEIARRKLGGESICYGKGWPSPITSTLCGENPKNPTPPFTRFSMSLLSQQQANLIPGLNLSALGIFSTGLSMLPSTPGARGAAAAAPYHPFAVSARGFGVRGMRSWGRSGL